MSNTNASNGRFLKVGQAVAVLCAIWSFSAWADRKAIVFPDATVHSNADDFSQIIGTYHRRTTVTVGDKTEAGWYRVIFPAPVKGFSVGWIRQDAIESFVGGSTKPRRLTDRTDEPVKSKSTGRKRSYDQSSGLHSSNRAHLGVVLDYFFMSPSAFQEKVGETKESVAGLGFGLEYGTFFSDRFEGFGRFSYFSFSRDSTVTSVAEAYFAKGYIISFGGDYLFVHRNGFDLGIGLVLGFALSTAGNSAPDSTARVIQKSTSGVLSPTYGLRMIVGKAFGEKFGLRGELGYRILNLTGLPVTAIGSSTDATADMSLSGLFLGLSLNYLF